MDEVAFWFAHVLCMYDGKIAISLHGMGSRFWEILQQAVAD